MITLESVCCLLVLNSVTSTPQWIRSWSRVMCMMCVCLDVNVCSEVLGTLNP
jgi:hypothetical protein